MALRPIGSIFGLLRLMLQPAVASPESLNTETVSFRVCLHDHYALGCFCAWHGCRTTICSHYDSGDFAPPFCFATFGCDLSLTIRLVQTFESE